MTHEEQIKWMSDRIAHLETQYESAMQNTATLMGHLGTKRPWVGLTVQEVGELWDADGTGYIPQKQLQFYAGIWDKLKEKNQ